MPTTTKTIWNPHTWPEYCTSPSDAWPIIKDNVISISLYPGGDCIVQDSIGLNHTEGKNPLRAAMIVYLMMKDSEND